MTKRLVARCRLFLIRDSALSITEYGMLVAFLALLIIVVVLVLGSGLSSWFASKTGSITTV